MANFRHSPFESTLEIVATLRDTSIRASVKDKLRHGPAERKEFMDSVVRAYKSGVSLNDLSDASGLTVDAIRQAADPALVTLDR